MVSVVIYNHRNEERELFLSSIRQAAAKLTDEEWNIDFFEKQENLVRFIKDIPLLDMIFYDVVPVGSIDYLERIRRHYKTPLLFLIADCTMSPMDYIRPSILASSLLLRPISAQILSDRILELVQEINQRNFMAEEEHLLIESKEGKTYIPLAQIFYFEAREKKIYLRLKKQELTFYDTIEHLAECLPESFVRCHRSFIISKSRIRKVMLSKNLIVLEQGLEIPLSRSYKSVFKEII